MFRDQVGVSLGLLEAKLGEVTYIKLKRADLRSVLGLADASEWDLRVWLDRTQNKEVLATIADNMIEDGRFSVEGGVCIVEVSLNELLKSKARFETDPVSCQMHCDVRPKCKFALRD